MRFEDLKVGDKVYIREDLEVNKEYGGWSFISTMLTGEQKISEILFCEDLGVQNKIRLNGKSYVYTSEMIDWEKTTALNKATINNIKPNHYKLNIKGVDLEVKDIMQEVMGKEQYKGFLYGNAIKYILRAYKKNGVEDLEKARKYIGWLIEQEK